MKGRSKRSRMLLKIIEKEHLAGFKWLPATQYTLEEAPSKHLRPTTNSGLTKTSALGTLG